MPSRYAPIEDYGVIGDLHTVALVGKDGSIDFLCLPSFDSPSVFAALLDAERGGRFQIAPQLDEAARKQLYLPDTNVLLTRFLSDDGVAEVSDFMPVEDAGQAPQPRAPRQDRARRGALPHALRRRASTMPAPRTRSSGAATGRCSSSAAPAPASWSLRLRSSVAAAAGGRRRRGRVHARRRRVGLVRPRGGDRRTSRRPRASARLRARGVQADGQLLAPLDRPLHLPGPLARDGEPLGPDAQAPHLATARLDRRRAHVRAARDTSAACATGTTATPGSATRPSRSTASCGSATPTRRRPSCAGSWRAVDELEPDGSLQIMYGIDGRHALPEETLSHLEGYMGSRPVRIGNAAYTHLQLDIYGELMDAVYLYDKYGSPDPPRRVDEHRAAGRLGVRTLAREGRGHLGGARRAPGVPLLAGDVLGGDRPGHPSRRKALVPGAAGALARRAGHDLSRHLRAVLGSDATRLRPGGRLHDARRRQRC